MAPSPAKENEQNEHLLTANQIKLIREYDQGIVNLNNQKQGALMAIVREAELSGVWDLDIENGKLVFAKEQPAKEQTQ